MKIRLISLLLSIFMLIALFSGCNSSSENGLESSNGDSSVTTEESKAVEEDKDESSENSQDETDFFTENGHGILPEDVDIPSHCVATETEFLYELDLPIPEAEGFNTYVSNNILLLFYMTGDGQYCDMISLADCSLIKRIPVGYDCEWGQFENGGFWLADRQTLEVKFYDTEGNEALVREGSNDDEKRYPAYLYVTDDGKFLVTSYYEGSPVEIYALGGNEVITPEIPENMEIWNINEISNGIYFDGGEGLGYLYNPLTNQSQAFCMEETIGDFYGDTFYCVRDSYLKLGALGSDAFFYVPSDFNVNLLDIDFGCTITSEYVENSLIFSDLRNGVFVSIDRDDNIYGFYATFLDDGTALVFEYSENGTLAYVFDAPSALKSATETFEAFYCTDAELQQKIDSIAQGILESTGVELFYGSQGNDFDIYDYVGVAELDLYEIYHAVTTTEEILSIFPEGMLRESYSATNKGLRLYLCGDIYGVQSGSIDMAGGVTTDINGYVGVVLDIHDNLWYNIPHEFSHVFDNRIAEISREGEIDWLSMWDEATPVENPYSYSYDDYINNNDYTFYYSMEDEDVWFIDGYARTFPTEDRARLFEYMFIPETDPAFIDIYDYENLVYKAKLYSYILRQCFPSCNGEDANSWERNLGDIDSVVLPEAENAVPVG